MKLLYKFLLITLLLIGSGVVEAYCGLEFKIKLARARDCRGFGICFIWNYVIDTDFSKENEVIATLGINQKKQLTLTVNKNEGMSPETFEKYFSDGFFICEDDYPLPKEILKSLNYDSDFIIQEGKYPVQIDNDKVTVVF